MANAAMRRGGDVADEVEHRATADGDHVGMPIETPHDEQPLKLATNSGSFLQPFAAFTTRASQLDLAWAPHSRDPPG